MVYRLNTSLPSQFLLGIPQRLEQLSPMYHIVWEREQHTLQVGCIFSDHFESLSGMITQDWVEGGVGTKIYMFCFWQYRDVPPMCSVDIK